jgi:hypothetical protein
VNSLHSRHASLAKVQCISKISHKVAKRHAFFSLSGKSGQRSFLSPLLQGSTTVRISMSGGIVNVATDMCDQRYELIQVPHGHRFPDSSTEQVLAMHSDSISISIDTRKQKFTVQGQPLKFPRGRLFRLAVVGRDSFNFEISNPSAFSETVPSDDAEVELPPSEPFVKYTPPPGPLPSDFRNIKKILIKVSQPSVDELLSWRSPDPPILAHVDLASHASPALLEFQGCLLAERLSRQFLAIAHMRVAAVDAARVSTYDLFRILIFALEALGGHCGSAVASWDDAYPRRQLYLGLEAEAALACGAVIGVPALAARIAQLSAEPLYHYASLPNGFVR